MKYGEQSLKLNFKKNIPYPNICAKEGLEALPYLPNKSFLKPIGIVIFLESKKRHLFSQRGNITQPRKPDALQERDNTDIMTNKHNIIPKARGTQNMSPSPFG